MDLIDLIAKTASRDELIALLRSKGRTCGETAAGSP